MNDLNTLMKSLIIYSILLYLVGCATEPEENVYNIYFRNETNTELKISTFFEGSPVNQYELQPGQSVLDCTYYYLSFQGYDCLNDTDSVEFRFLDHNGYISTLMYNSSGFDFANCNVFSRSSNCYINTQGDDWNFVITQEMYENAHDLP